MKNPFRWMTHSIFLFLILTSLFCQKQSTDWKGTIAEEDGVIVVKNPKEPVYGQEIFALEEELSIGMDGESFILSMIRDIAVDDDGRIYVLDYKEGNVKIFNKSGEYLHSIGKKGEGPQELAGPIFLWITSLGEVMIEDIGNKAIKLYSFEGELKHSISTAKIPYFGRTAIDSENNIVGMNTVMDPEDPKVEVKKYDFELNLISTIATGPGPNPRKFNPFGGVPWYQVDNDDNIVYSFTENYEIQIINPEGELVRKIIKDYDPVEITEEEKERELKVVRPDFIDIPKFHSAFNRYRLGDDGKIYVQTWKKSEDGSITYYDVFDPEGRFVVEIPLSCDARIWKKGKLYAIEEDEEGFQVVKRYKVNWSIK